LVPFAGENVLVSIIAIAGVAYLILMTVVIGWCVVTVAGRRAVIVWDDEATAPHRRLGPSRSRVPIEVRPTWVKGLTAPRQPGRR